MPVKNGILPLFSGFTSIRIAPTWAMAQVTDGLQRLFSSSTPAVAELRNRGLTLVDRLPPVKRWLTARALDS